jgi:hypothetical protein
VPLGHRTAQRADAIEVALAAMPDEHNGAQRELMTSTERIEVLYHEPFEETPSIRPKPSMPTPWHGRFPIRHDLRKETIPDPPPIRQR